MAMFLSVSCGGIIVSERPIQNLESFSWKWIPDIMYIHFQDPFSYVYLVRAESSRFS